MYSRDAFTRRIKETEEEKLDRLIAERKAQENPLSRLYRRADSFFKLAESTYGDLSWNNAHKTYRQKYDEWASIGEDARAAYDWVSANPTQFGDKLSSVLSNIEDIVSSGGKLIDSYKSTAAYYDKNLDALTLYENAHFDPDFANYHVSDWSALTPEQQKSMMDVINPHSWLYYAGIHGQASKADEVDFYNALTDDERDIVTYYALTGQTEKAKQFMQYMEDIVNEREARAKYDATHPDGKARPLMDMLTALNSGFAQAFEGYNYIINNALLLKDEKPAISQEQYLSGYTRENLGSVNRVLYDLANTTANMIPSIGIGTVTGGVGGSVALGLSAAGNAAAEMRRAGYSSASASAYGTLIGLSETVLSQALSGVAGLGGDKSLTTLLESKLLPGIKSGAWRFAAEFGLDMAGEGLEEALQEVLDPIIKAAVTGEKFEGIDLGQVIYSGLLGALAAGPINAVHSVATVPRQSKSARETYSTPDAVRALAEDVIARSRPKSPLADITSMQKAPTRGSTAIAENVLTRVAQGKKVSGLDLMSLEKRQSELIEADIAEATTSAIAKRLTKLGETGDVNKLATAIKKRLTGEKLSTSEAKLIKESEFADQVIYEIRKASQPTQAESPSTSPLRKKESVPVSPSGQTETKSGEKVKVVEVASVKDGKMMLKLDNGKTVEADDVLYATDDEGYLYQRAQDLQMDAATANSFIKGYDGSVSTEVYVSAFSEAYRKGAYGIELTEADRSGLSEMIRPDQVDLAYRLGEVAAKYATEANQARVASKKATKTDTTSRKDRKYGKIHLGDIPYTVDQMSERQRASIEVLNKLAEALNLDNIYLFESPVVKGKRLGFNGKYENGRIYLDIFAGNNGEQTILFTAAHELTHFIREYSPTKFKTFADFLVKNYGKKGVDVEALIREQQAKAKRNGRELSYDDAYEEVIADSCESFLSDSDIVSKIVELKTTDKTLWEKIKTFLKKWLDKVRALYKGFEPNSYEGQLVKEMVDKLDQLHSLWAEALVDASEAATRGSVTQETANAGVKNSARYSERITVDLSDDTELSKLVDGVHGALKYKTIAKYILDVLGDETIILSDGKQAIVDKRDALHIANKAGTEKTAHIAKIREIIETAQLYAQDDNVEHNKFSQFLYYEVIVKYNGEKYPLYINVGLSKYDKTYHIYDITKKIRDTANRINGLGRLSLNESDALENGISSISVPQESDSVKRSDEKFSDRDSDGHQLSQEQQEFFKNSKVRDEHGNLLVMYHGTPNATFTTFRSGSYFTEHKWYAERYKERGASSLSYKKTADNPDVYAVYLDIKKPFDTRNPEERRIFEEEYYRHYGMGTPLMESGLPDWLDGGDLQEFIEEMGYDYDGLILDEGSTGGYGDEVVSRGVSYMIFDPSQVKSVDNKTPTKDKDIHYSDRDSTYMDAVNAGDMETAQRMVDEAAKEAGYNSPKLYHGTNAFGFTTIQTTGVERGVEWSPFFATSNPNVATTYSGAVGTKNIGNKKRPNKSIGALRDEAISQLNDTRSYSSGVISDKVAADYLIEKFGGLMDSNTLKLIRSGKQGVYAADKQVFVFVPFENGFTLDDYTEQSGNYGLYANTENFLVVDGNGEAWNTIKSDFGTKTRQIAESALKQGYNGVIIKRIYDTGWSWNDALDEDSDLESDVYIFFNPQAQVKSADPVTYDDNGEVIPLSERFKSDKTDIRYSDRDSEGTELTEAQQTFFADSKVRDAEGRLIPLWHGTNSAGFTKFKRVNKPYASFFFTDSFEVAQSYSDSDQVIDPYSRASRKSSPNQNYRVYLNITNPLVVEGHGANWNRIPDKDGTLRRTDDFVMDAIEQGYDGVIFHDIYDSLLGGNIVSNVYVALNANQIKSTENKNPTKRKDIRYSFRDSESGTANDALTPYGAELTRFIAQRGDYQKKKAAKTLPMQNANGNTSETQAGQPSGNMIPQESESVKGSDEKLSDRTDYSELRANLEDTYLIDVNAILALAEIYLSNYGGDLTKTQFRVQFLSIANNLAKAIDTANQILFNMANNELLSLAEEIVTAHKDVGETAESLRAIKKHLRNIRIKIPERYKADFDVVGGFEAFRKNHIGSFILAKDGIDVDSLYPELQELFGKQWFSDDIDTVPDQLMRIAEVVDTSVSSVAELQYDPDEVKGDVAEEISEKLLNIISESSYFKRGFEESFSARSILANALESTAKTESERIKLQAYKIKIGLIEAEQERLASISAKIKKLSFATGKRDVETINRLKIQAKKITARISKFDNELLALEATRPLKDLLEREKRKVYKKEKQKALEALKTQREKAVEREKALKERYATARHEAMVNRERTKMRGKIKRVVKVLDQMLRTESKKKHVPIELQKIVAEALNIVNMDTVNAEARIKALESEMMLTRDPKKLTELADRINNIRKMGERMQEHLLKLKAAYDAILTSKDPMIQRGAHLPEVSKRIETVAEEIKDTPLREMTVEQLEDVYDLYKMVLTTVRNANKAHMENIKLNAKQAAEAIDAELITQKRRKTEITRFRAWAERNFWNMLKPIYAFKRIASPTLNKLFGNIRRGEDIYGRDIFEGRNFFQTLARQYNTKAWDTTTEYKFTSSSGEAFTLNLEQMMSLYAYAQRGEQALNHIINGGFLYDSKVVKKTKNGVEVVTQDANAYKISEETLGQIFTQLTDEQKQYVKEMQDYLSNVMGAKGNEVSLKLYGIKLFKESAYFPLHSAEQFQERVREANINERKLVNSGFTNKTVENATSPIVLTPFSQTWANHVHDMSMYHAFVLPLEDFYRAVNHRDYESEAEPDNARKTVYSTIENVYGKAATQYIDELLRDLNGGARSDSRIDTSAFLTKFKKAKTMFSASTIIQQPSSIGRAFAYIEPKYFVGKKLTKKKHGELWKEMQQYAPITILKEMGYFDTGVGASTTSWITAAEYSTGLEKVNAVLKDSDYRDEVFSRLPALADEVAWVSMWEAAKRKIAKEHTALKVGSSEYYKAVADLFTTTITNTQVYDSVLSRSGAMRSKDMGTKMLTAFMAEPTTTMNMVYEGIVDIKSGNAKLGFKKLGGAMASIVLNGLLVAIPYSMRDDDEEETFGEKYLSSLTSSLIDGITVFNYLPFVKDIWSLMQGFDVERTDVSLISDIVDSFDRVIALHNKDTDDMDESELAEHSKDLSNAWLSLGGDITSMLGVPFDNILREAKAVFNTAETVFGDRTGSGMSLGDVLEDTIRDQTPTFFRGDAETKTDRLYAAIAGGDSEYVTRIKSTYKDEKSYTSAVRKGLRENDPRITEAAQARLDGDTSKYANIVREITREYKFSQSDIIAAVNAQMSALKKGDETESSSSTSAPNMYTSDDLNINLDNGDYTEARQVTLQMIQQYVQDGKTETEAISLVKSGVTRYWKAKLVEAYINRDNTEMQRIRRILYNSGLYGSANDVVKTCQSWIISELSK